MGKPVNGKFDEILVALSRSDKLYLERVARMIRKRGGSKRLGARVIIRAAITALRRAIGTGSRIVDCNSEDDITMLLMAYLTTGAKRTTVYMPTNTKEVADGK